jgi:DNA-binding response OmpR family regulator
MLTKILIVEDDVAILDSISKYLAKNGFQTYTVKSAEEGEEILRNEEIYTVLTDIKLPGTDGIKFTHNIKKRYNLDVIIMTGYSSEYSYGDAINNGASDLIFKPIKLNELVLRINRVLRERSLYRFAGDEFTIILPETTSGEAKSVADRILAKY